MSLTFVLCIWARFNKNKMLVIGLIDSKVDSRYKSLEKIWRNIKVIASNERYPRTHDQAHTLPDDPINLDKTTKESYAKSFLKKTLEIYQEKYNKIIEKGKYSVIMIDRATIHGLFIDIQTKNEDGKEHYNALCAINDKADDHSKGIIRKSILVLLLLTKCYKNLARGGSLIFDRQYIGDKHLSQIKQYFKETKVADEKFKCLDLNGTRNNSKFIELTGFEKKDEMVEDFKSYVNKNGVSFDDNSPYEIREVDGGYGRT